MCLTKFLLTPALTVMLAVGASASANDSANDILPTGTLPIVYIVTENGKPIVEKEEKIPAGFWIDPAQSGCAAFGSESNPVPFTVSGRGNYTWSGFDKKPYKVKFNEKQSLFNLPKSKHYALLAHADDELGFLRNTMGFELHWHYFTEVLYLQEGSLLVSCNDVVYPMEAGSFILFPPQAVHALAADHDKPFRFFCVKFNLNRIHLISQAELRSTIANMTI